MRSVVPALALTAVAALTLTSCSLLPGGGSGELTWEDSPLNKYLSAAWDSDLSEEEQMAQFEQQQREEQELLAQCMADEGFEYTPWVQDSSMVFGSSGDEDDMPVWEPDDRKWVEKYGYGAVYSPWDEYYEEHPEEMYEGEETVDPNQAYVESLSETEQQAYFDTLYGVFDDEAYEEDEIVEWNWEDSGCQGYASHEVYQSQDLLSSDEFAGLLEALQEMGANSEDSPEMREIDNAWSQCMADAGEPGFTTQYAAQESIYDAMNEVWESFYDDLDPAIFEDPEAEVPDPKDSPEMEAIFEQEVALALKDLDCREKVNYTQEQLKAQFAMEERFIQEHKAELDAFKAAAEQSK
ncbi:hypothetical protein [Microbacterium sp. YY-01]|uniref:hypothetical protein n=1 Tax=Microbacterium sp. YY-01 TaxID=3421634 RepID=UPI003D187691